MIGLTTRRQLMLSAAASALLPTLASANAFPSRPITLICPFGAGGSQDLYFRALAKAATEVAKVPVIIDNRAGAGGTRGAIALASTNSTPDGYTISVIGNGVFTGPWLQKTSYDPLLDLNYLMGVLTLEFGIAVPKDSPIQSLQQYVEIGKAKPDSLTFAAGDPNTTAPPLMTLFGKRTGAMFRHIPYKSGSDMVAAMMGGQVDSIIDSVGSLAPGLQSGAFRLLAVLGEQRLKAYPDVKTTTEQGIDLKIYSQIGLATARNTPPAVSAQLHSILKASMNDKEVRATADRLGLGDWYKTGAEFDAFARRSSEEAGKLLYEAGVIKEMKRAT